ncbi:MAG: SGNH/GDSL hydrolase family protein [bacterium]|nr:SGNH/GDSL hydrolase family protein [bacterium]
MAAFYLCILVSRGAHAGDLSWTRSHISIDEDSEDQFREKTCKDKELMISGYSQYLESYCYYNYGDWGYAKIGVDGAAFVYGEGNPAYVLREVIGGSTGPIVYHIPGTDRLLVIDLGNNEFDKPATNVISNVKDRLVLEYIDWATPKKYEYGLSVDNPDFVIESTYGDELPVAQAVAVSQNGEWAVFGFGSPHDWSGEGNTHGFVRLNLRTFEVKRFASIPDYWNYIKLDISNDGRSVAAAYHSKVSFYDIDNNCGDSKIANTANYPIENECASQHYGWPLISSNSDISKVEFTDDDLSVLLMDDYHDKIIKLSIGNGSSSNHIEYLAMGDSYSSGEGDIRGENHYLVGTDKFGECHVSDRSYPFLLRDYYGISPNRMKSVACSGAQVVFDYMGNDANYLGQENRLEAYDLSEIGLIQRRQSALDNFQPGEAKQINFVKKYKPSVVTFTGGGNDVGFERVLKYCAYSFFTCEYAKYDSDLKQLLYDSIDSQYQYNTMFIREIKKASSKTRVILVGYPKFIAEYNYGCSLFSPGLLDNFEIGMINDAISYMNDMLEGLAEYENISYVDVENSLEGGRICESRGYVNSVTDVGVDKVKNDDPSVFHPNHLGHEKIARTIIDKNVFLKPDEPDDCACSVFDPPAPKTLTLPQNLVEESKAIWGNVMKMTTSINSFSPYSLVKAILHSDPMLLGEFDVDADGSINAEIPTYDLPPGEHVLILEGRGLDHKPVKYYQYISIDDPSEIAPEPKIDNDTPKSTNSLINERIEQSEEPTIDEKNTSTYVGSPYKEGNDKDMSYIEEYNRSLTNNHFDEVIKGHKNESKNKITEDRSNLLILIIVMSCIILIIGVVYAKYKRRS